MWARGIFDNIEGIAKYQNARRSIEITKLGVTAAGKRDAEQGKFDPNRQEQH
jgi:hypothetical protein